MGQTFGRQEVGNFGTSIDLSSDGNPERKSSGLTIDWSSVTAAGADATLYDGVNIKSGEKYLRYGQVVTRIVEGEINTLTLDATGGNYTLSINDGTNNTTAQNWNGTNGSLKTALEALPGVGTGNATVSGPAGGPFSISFNTALGDVTLESDPALLTGGAGTATIVTTSEGNRHGKYGPYDPAVVDGRATLTDGTVFLVNRTVKESDVKSDHPDVMLGGEVWRDRLLATSGNASLAAGPTLAALRAVLPRLILKLTE